MKTFTLRAGRKVAHLSSRTFHKSAHFMDRVERKLGKMAANSSLGDLSGKKGISVDDYIAKSNQILVPIQPALPKLRKPSVTLVLNSINNAAFYGGAATASIIAARLATKLGMPMRIVCVDRSGKSEVVRDFLNKSGVEAPEGEIDVLDLSGRRVNYYGYLDLHPEDVLITTAWWTQRLLKDLSSNRKTIYLIQDYEPVFYLNGDLRLWAEQTYEEGNFIPLINSSILHEHLKLQSHDFIAKEGIHFNPAVSSEVFSPREGPIEPGHKRRLFFYARPNVHRNLFFTGLQVLERVFTKGMLDPDEWEVVLAGQDNYPSLSMGGVALKNFGKMSLEEYAEFARTVDVALSLMMAPHPSYPPLEMAASGAMVVTNTYENKTDLSEYSDNILIADLNVEKLAEALHEATKIPRKTRLERAKQNKMKRNWSEAVDPAIDAVIKRL